MTVAQPDIALPTEACGEVKPLAEISRLARLAATGVIPDAIRRLKRLAPLIGADAFALFFVGHGAPATRLMPCFDESFPARSAATNSLSTAEALLNHATCSSLPAGWSMVGGHPLLAGLPALQPNRGGLALPVSADPAHAGVFVFTGARLHADAAAIEDLHLACFEIFTAVAQVKSSSITTAASISRRELECLMLTAAGRTSEDIARILGLSIHTANQYLTTASGKLDVVNRTQAVARAIRLGLIE